MPVEPAGTATAKGVLTLPGIAGKLIVVTAPRAAAEAYVSGAEIPIDGGHTSSSGIKYMSDSIAAAATNRPPQG
jgi:hypothetical protein